MSAAARKGDTCVPHCSPFTISEGSGTVYINGKSAARVGDAVTPHLKPGPKFCPSHTATIASGSGSVYIDGKPAAWVGSSIENCTSVSGGSGDADLYVRKGSNPTSSAYACRPYLSGNNETCTLPAATGETWYVGLYAYRSYSAVTLTARVVPPPGDAMEDPQVFVSVAATLGVPLMIPLLVFKLTPLGKLLPELKA